MYIESFHICSGRLILVTAACARVNHISKSEILLGAIDSFLFLLPEKWSMAKGKLVNREDKKCLTL